MIDPQWLVLDEMPPLSTRVFKTPAIAVINPLLHTEANANLVLKVNGEEIPHPVQVLTPIQVASHRIMVETATGAGRAFIAIQNISALRSTGEVKVNLLLPRQNIARVLGVFEAGQIKEADMNISGLDPLELIKGIDAGIQVTMNDRFMSDGKVRFIPADVNLELASYFDQLIKGPGLVPASLKAGDRIMEVRKMIAAKNPDEVTSDMKGNPWKDDRLSTLLRQVVENLRSVDQTSATRGIYARLGEDIWEHCNKLGKFLFFKSGKRKAYEALCKELMQRK